MTKAASYEPQWYESPINLPQRQETSIAIEHRLLPVGEKVHIVGMRQALLRGTRPVSGIVRDRPLRIHVLRETGGGVWMTDLPEELNQVQEMLHRVRPFGRVLVGGLGLGIVARACRRWLGVEEVVVVEHNPDVIALCGQGLPRVECADIAAFLKGHAPPAFDAYLLDTWAGTSENTWWSEVMPLRRTIRQRFGQRPLVHCWAEDIMIGQLFQALTTAPPHWYYSHLPVPMPARTAHAFLRDVGTLTWEQRYGAAIDRTSAELAGQ